MSKESDSDEEAGSGSGADSDWLSEEGPLNLRDQGRKRKLRRQSSRQGSLSLSASRQKRPRSSSSVHQRLGRSIKTKPKFPVTCGNKKGILHKDKFNKCEPCILSESQWFTPTEFEKFGGKERNKKWKISIFYGSIPLQTFIQNGFLSSPRFKTKRSQDKEPGFRKELFLSRRTRYDNHMSESVSASDSNSESNHSDDEDEEEEDDDDDKEDDRVTEREFTGNFFNVTCSTGRGRLHVNRFATETCGKCIRTEDAWLTPKDFLNQNKPDGNWRRDIISNGDPLGMLIMRRMLKPHMLNCRCPICTGNPLYLLDQNNDDVCFKCNHEGDLVCCNKCPRAFHHHCHKPALTDDTTGDPWSCSFCKKSLSICKK
ncbi:nuclear body protein SP140-like [Neoarius graeffei]|uniref:nuclear body protein SP140-like n=1 Tax=Neoarius graeffei TaxID=443677 RepID=UPI00298C7225|nr:nuclear body protein SP140-like [Neoarius graeffei]XP_060760357.1 nuclear body protein SP140-like [Neoarius graeffei]